MMVLASALAAFALLLPAATLLDQGPDAEAAIRRARANSNRAIERRNLLGVADSLAEDFVAVVGNGGFVPSKQEYLRLFKQDFDSGSKRLIYERTPDSIEVNEKDGLAAEHGHWVGRTASGATPYSGTYTAMWRLSPKNDWQIRSELFITLVSPHHSE